MTKAERERIKVTCLWCENIATTHLVCLPCRGPLSDADKARYLRAMVLDMERAQRKCQCGALIPYEARQGTIRCAHCRATHRTREYQLSHPNARLNRKRDADSCVRCGANANGKTKCPRCLAKHYDSVRAMKAKRRSAGMCVDCGISSATNGQKCKACAAKANKAVSDARMIAIADGKCGRCKRRPRKALHTHCAPCMAVKRKQNAKAPPRRTSQ